MGFMAAIFNALPGLSQTDNKVAEAATERVRRYSAAEDLEASREERAYRIWINSLGLDYEHVTDLASGMRDGILVLQILDTVQPGAVDWKKVGAGSDAGRKLPHRWIPALSVFVVHRMFST